MLPNFNLDNKPNEGAALLCVLEPIFLAVIVFLIMFFRYLIKDTINHVSSDIEQYELNSIKWAK